MNLVLFYSLSLSVLISLSSADELLSYEHPGLINCVPANCGNVTNITYPFWVLDLQPSYCGDPSFKLTCDNQKLIFPTSNNISLQVKNIFYETQSVLVVDETFADVTCGFTHWSPLNDSIFDLNPFSISDANMKLVFLYNCSKPPSNYYKINCTSGVYTTYAVWDSNLRYYPETCKYAYVPVAGYMGDNLHDFLKAVNYGFLLDWRIYQCEECKSPEKKRILGAVIGVVCVGGAFLLGTCVVLFSYGKRKLKANLSNFLSRIAASILFFKRNSMAGETCYNTHIFSYDELKEATQKFHKSTELGHGGFGTVYKGKLRDGRTVAVKRLHENNYRLKQFVNEVEILSRVRHQNLVMLYGCTSLNSHELLLVYEYIPNGTLADHLHGPLAMKGRLPWPIRMSIIIQTAEALAYLHSVEPQIIHRDIKTNNILVDNNFQVKVADFGISRLFPLDATHVSTKPQGTFGYLDPEYYLRFQLTDKSDVYSFGVVLIELISSKPAVDIRRHSDEISLAIMAITKIQNCRIGELVDPDLGYESNLEITEMINQVAQLAFRCLLSNVELRPGFREVVGVLKRLNGEADADGVGGPVKEEPKSLSNVELLSSDYLTGR